MDLNTIVKVEMTDDGYKSDRTSIGLLFKDNRGGGENIEITNHVLKDKRKTG